MPNWNIRNAINKYSFGYYSDRFSNNNNNEIDTLWNTVTHRNCWWEFNVFSDEKHEWTLFNKLQKTMNNKEKGTKYYQWLTTHWTGRRTLTDTTTNNRNRRIFIPFVLSFLLLLACSGVWQANNRPFSILYTILSCAHSYLTLFTIFIFFLFFYFFFDRSSQVFAKKPIIPMVLF